MASPTSRKSGRILTALLCSIVWSATGDLQRATADIESEMERSREHLTREMMSLEDIRHTITDPVKEEGSGEDASGELLF